MRRIVSALLVLGVVALGWWILFHGAGNRDGATVADGGRTVSRLSQLPLYFIENQGQTDGQVGYYLQGRDTSVYFVPGGVVFALSEPRAARAEGVARIERAAFVEGAQRERWAVKLEFVGANREARPEGVERTGAVVSYFKGPREKWAAGLATYAGVRYRELWPGIGLEYTGTQGKLKYTFTVAPGADAGRIRLAYHGAEGVELTPDGRIAVRTPAGGFAEDVPYVYQEVNGRRVAVAAAYELDGDTLAFRLGEYDHSRPLVLDPAVLVYAGYIGGSASDYGLGIAVDGAGNAYVTGYTASDQATFPVAVGLDTSYNGGDADVFVAKVNAAGTGLVYATYLGGAGSDSADGIAVDGAGNAYVTGWTKSDQASFPVLVGPDTSYNGGSHDVFVAKVNAAGTALVYAGYIGGTGEDGVQGIAVDTAGNAYVAGYTDSNEATFPVKKGPDLTYAGARDMFVAKVNATGSGLEYCGYVGGWGDEYGGGIAVDSSGNAYVTGSTWATEDTFPVKGGPDITFNGGMYDAFVAKVNAAGTALDYCGYIGGNGTDNGSSIAVDAAGNAYVLGDTRSGEESFPLKGGPDLTFNGGSTDLFVAKVNATGTALEYCGYIGGSGSEYPGGIGVDGKGSAYAAGYTSSYEATFPVSEAFDATFGGGSESFVAKINAAGTALVYSTYLGGSSLDVQSGLAVDGEGNVYVAGSTLSNEGTFPVITGPDTSFNGGTYDGYVAKIGFNPAASAPSVTAIVSAASYGGGGVSPGEIVAIYGTNLGPAGGLSNSGWEPSTGKLPTVLGGSSVSFDGKAAPLFYVSAGQINAQVPYEVSGKVAVNVTVSVNGTAGAAFRAVVVTAHPGVFVYQDRAIITDNATGALITAANGIERDAYANIWATGPGVVNPPATTGAPAGASALNWAANPQVWINGNPVEVAFAGLTPGMAGLLQVTVKIPSVAPVGANVPLKISINGAEAQAWIGAGLTSNLTIAIR